MAMGQKKRSKGMKKSKTMTTVTKKVKVPKLKDTTKAQVTSLVKNIISETVETKYKGSTIYNQVNFNNRISTSDWRQVCPPVAQSGSAANSFTRIGDRIKPKGLYVEGFIAIDQNEARALNMSLDIFVVQHRSKKSWAALQTGGGQGITELSSYLLDDGQGNKFGYDGTLEHALFPINNDLVKLIKHKRVNLYSSFTDVIQEQQDCQTRRFVRVAFKVPTPSTLIYDNALDPLNPTNYCPVMAFGFTYPDGLAAETLVDPVQATFRTRLYYDDA